MFLDEGQHTPPRIVARILPLGKVAVEEAVWRALVDVHLVGNLGLGELLVEIDEGFARSETGKSTRNLESTASANYERLSADC